MAERFLMQSGSVNVLQRAPHSCCDFLSQVSQKDLRDELLKDRYGKPTVIVVDRKGFVPQAVTVCEGQVVAFESTNPEDFPSKGYNVIQLIHDGHQLKVVPGGYQFVITGKRCRFEMQFGAEGEYKFGCGVLRCPPVTVRVQKRPTFEMSVGDKGFQEEVVYLYAGTTVKFTWSNCIIARRVYPAVFCYAHGGLCRVPQEMMPSSAKSGSFQFTCRTNGVYYFSTEDQRDLKGRCFVCVVIVGDLSPERIVYIGDSQCKPQMSFVTQNGSVQLRWSDQPPFMSKLMHCAYQAEVASLDLSQVEARAVQFRPVKDGFHWPETSITGILRHTAPEVGTVQFSDYNHMGQFASYIGSIIVTPKPNDIAVIVDDKGFTPEVLQANLYDRVWFGWDVVKRRTKPIGIVFSKCDVMYNWWVKYNYGMFERLEGTRSKLEFEHMSLELVLPSVCRGENCIKLDLRNLGLLTDSGLRNIRLPAVGVFYYVKRRRFPKDENKVLKGLTNGLMVGSRNQYTYDEKDDENIDEDAPLNTISIIVNYNPQDHVVSVVDSEFEPTPLYIGTEDRVWWIWKDINYPKNIVQCWPDGSQLVNEDNIPIGFSSGALVNPPFAFMYQFQQSGVYHYLCTDDLTRIGTVNVIRPPRVKQISLKNNEIEPKVISCSPRDICCWLLRKLTVHMLVAVDARGDRILEVTAELPEKNAVNAPVQVLDEPNAKMLRRCFSRTFENPGVYHFSSRAFLQTTNPKEKLTDELVSTVIVDDVPDDEFVLVSYDREGQLTPAEVTILPGETVAWIPAITTTKEVKVLIELLQDEDKIKMVSNAEEKKKKRFRAFLGESYPHPIFTFYVPGRYKVTYRSEDVKSYGMIVVEEDAKCAPCPTWHQNAHLIHFEVDADPSLSPEIYYTIDGTVPLPGRVRTFTFNSEEKITIPKGKYVIVRTRCYMPGYRYSPVVSSSRLWIPAHLVFADVLKPELGFIDEEMTLSCQIQPLTGAVQIVINNVGRLDPDVDSMFLFVNKKPLKNMLSSTTRTMFVTGLTQCRKYEMQVAFVRGGLANSDVMSKPSTLIYPPYTPSGTITLTASISKKLTPVNDEDTMKALFSWVPLGPVGMNYKYQFFFNGMATDYEITDEQARKSVEMKFNATNDKDGVSRVLGPKRRNRCAVVVQGLRFDTVYAAYVVATSEDELRANRPVKSNICYFNVSKNETNSMFFNSDVGILQFCDAEGEQYHEFVQLLNEWDYSVVVNGEEVTRQRDAARKRAANMRRKPGLVGATKTRSRFASRPGQSRTRKQQSESEQSTRLNEMETAALTAATSTLTGD